MECGGDGGGGGGTGGGGSAEWRRRRRTRSFHSPRSPGGWWRVRWPQRRWACLPRVGGWYLNAKGEWWVDGDGAVSGACERRGGGGGRGENPLHTTNFCQPQSGADTRGFNESVMSEASGWVPMCAYLVHARRVKRRTVHLLYGSYSTYQERAARGGNEQRASSIQYSVF